MRRCRILPFHRRIVFCELHNGLSPVFSPQYRFARSGACQISSEIVMIARSFGSLHGWCQAPSSNSGSLGAVRCFDSGSSKSQPSLPLLAPVRYVQGWYPIHTTEGRVDGVMSHFHLALSTLGVVVCFAEQATAAPNLTVYTRLSKRMGGPGYDGYLFWYPIAL